MIRPGEFSFQARPGMNGNFLIPAYNDSSGGVFIPGPAWNERALSDPGLE
jgi:hypothetical protein